MLIDLRTLEPNPMRDFAVDPIDDERVKDLQQSIEDDGFWGGVVCRRLPDGRVQIGAGHHRVQAALAAGITVADVFVADDMDDTTMVRVYATENATQRGNTGSAQAGTVASAVRMIAKAELTGTIGSILPVVENGEETMLGKLTSEEGIGWRAVLALLPHVRGLNQYSVTAQLANLKASGDYGRIIAEVREEIERENEAALAALAEAEAEQARIAQEWREAQADVALAKAEQREARKRAREAQRVEDRKRAQLEAQQAKLARQKAEAMAKLAEKRAAEAEAKLKEFQRLRKTRNTAREAAEAAQRPRVFDFAGVAKHLKHPRHIQVFRQVVTGQGMRHVLPVECQAQLAEMLVAEAQRAEVELTGIYIREHAFRMLTGAKQDAWQWSRRERQRLEREDIRMRALSAQEQFVQGIYLIEANGHKLNGLYQSWPRRVPFPVKPGFVRAIARAKTVIDTLVKRSRRYAETSEADDATTHPDGAAADGAPGHAGVEVPPAAGREL
jgi:ParB-like chromosome segregation protein Spo0J